MPSSPTTWVPSFQKGRLYALAAALLWSTSGATVKSLEMHPSALAMYRGLIAAAFLFGLMALTRRPISFRWGMIGMSLFFTVMNYSYIASMTYTTAANAIFLQYTSAVWMTLGSVLFLGEAVDRRQLWALLGLVVGVAFIVGGSIQSATDALGIALGLLSGFSYGMVALCLRAYRGHDPLLLSAVNHLFAGLILVAINQYIVGTGRGPNAMIEWPTDPKTLGLLFLFGTVQIGLAYVIFALCLRHISAQEAGMITLIEPVLNPCWAYLVIGEIPNQATLCGGAVILAALVFRYMPVKGAQMNSPAND